MERSGVQRLLCWLQMPMAVALAIQWGYYLSESPEQLFSFSTERVYAHDLYRALFWPPWRSWCSCRLAKLVLHFSPWNGLAVPLIILLLTNCFFGPVKCALVIFCMLVYYLQMIKKRPLVHSSQIMCLAARGSQLPLTGVHVSSYDVHACRNMCTWEMCCSNSPDGWLIFIFMKLICMYVRAMWLYTSTQHAMCMDTRRGQRPTLNVIPPVLSTLFFKTGPHWSRTHQVDCAAKVAILRDLPSPLSHHWDHK